MIGLLSILTLGFFLGMRHATDPDHVIAVTTIVARYRRVSPAALVGAFWGLGHTLTILLVGGGIILFGWVIPARIGLSMEFSVGLMLILLGALNLSGFLERISSGQIRFRLPSTPNGMGSDPHQPRFESDPPAPREAPLDWCDSLFGRLGFYHAVRPFIVGLVHGLAGSAAVALLVLTTIRTPEWAIAYLLVFGAGTIAGMMLITGTMVLPFAWAADRFSRLHRGLRVVSGLISVGFGFFLVYQIGFASGLLTGHPRWTPR
jgi:High-affinity nickel-transport protein